MSSTATTSERLLADVACGRLRGVTDARVLIGGLGLGYSLRQVLELVGPRATVHVAELLPEVVEWNREFLMAVNGKLLDDRRVEVFTEDVFELIRKGRAAKYDAILLDVDNGPTSFVQPKNSRLYDRGGLVSIRRALKDDGIVSFWSATEEPAFVRNLERAGYTVEIHEARAHERAKRSAHRIYAACWGAASAHPTPRAKSSDISRASN